MIALVRRTLSSIAKCSALDLNLAAQVTQISPLEPMPNHEPLYKPAVSHSHELTVLPNGVRVITESEGFPGNSHFGVLIESGTRDETEATSGSCSALKTMFLLAKDAASEHLNFSRVVQSGGEFTMNYNSQHIFFQGQCLPCDSSEFIKMMVDCALNPKYTEDANLKIRLKNRWAEYESSLVNSLDKKLDALLPTLAYGQKGIGMPSMGIKSNLGKLTVKDINEFLSSVISPDRIVVVGSNVRSHNDFLMTVGPHFDHLKPKKLAPREKAEYIGGEHREDFQSDMINFMLGFEGVSFRDPWFFVANVLKTLIGQGGGFSSGGPGKGMHSRSYTTILPKYPFIESIAATNTSFIDSGLFAIKIVGLSNYGGNISESIVHELADLINITELEVQRAKNLLKTQILLTLEKTAARLEESAKSYSSFGRPCDRNYYIQSIDKVTREQVRAFLLKMLSKKPTLITIGGDSKVVPHVDIFEKVFQNFIARIKSN